MLTHLYPYVWQARGGAIETKVWDDFRVMFNNEVRPWMYCMDSDDFAAKQRRAGGSVIAHLHYHSGRCTEPRDGRDTPNQASRVDEDIGGSRPEVVALPHEGQLEFYLTWRGEESHLGKIPLVDPTLAGNK